MMKLEKNKIRAVILLLIVLIIALIFYAPTNIEFKRPDEEKMQTFYLYVGQFNASGGITEDKYELELDRYCEIVDVLNNATFSRKLIDFLENKPSDVKYSLLIVPVDDESSGVALSELRIDVDESGQCESYIIAIKNGLKQTYKIRDEKSLTKIAEILINSSVNFAVDNIVDGNICI